MKTEQDNSTECVAQEVKPKSKCGGKRPGAGRKAHVPALKKCCLTLTDAQRKLLRKWGRGDMSAGLRWLIEAAQPWVIKLNEVELAAKADKGVV